MYSYNGVVLPKLPEWDKETYPYAFIYKILGSQYGFIVSDTRPYRQDDRIYCGSNKMGNLANPEVFHIPRADHAFTTFESYGNAVWTNTDILNTDGSVFLKATDPIPIYEGSVTT